MYLEPFDLSVKKYLAVHILCHTIGLKNSRRFFIQSEVKSIVTHAFSRALRQQLHVITLSFDWFTGLSVSFIIG